MKTKHWDNTVQYTDYNTHKYVWNIKIHITLYNLKNTHHQLKYWHISFLTGVLWNLGFHVGYARVPPETVTEKSFLSNCETLTFHWLATQKPRESAAVYMLWDHKLTTQYHLHVTTVGKRDLSMNMWTKEMLDKHI